MAAKVFHLVTSSAGTFLSVSRNNECTAHSQYAVVIPCYDALVQWMHVTGGVLQQLQQAHIVTVMPSFWAPHVVMPSF